MCPAPFVQHIQISIHPPRAGRDTPGFAEIIPDSISIHPPRAGRDASIRLSLTGVIFQSTRPVRGGTKALCNLGVCVNISIHPPRAGRDDRAFSYYDRPARFQSTRPVRGGTRAEVTRHMPLRFQSTRPVRGGTAQPPSAFLCDAISIHPPRAGRDKGTHVVPTEPKEFQSTRPVRGGT